jgi:hypothetical protein
MYTLHSSPLYQNNPVPLFAIYTTLSTLYQQFHNNPFQRFHAFFGTLDVTIEIYCEMRM